MTTESVCRVTPMASPKSVLIIEDDLSIVEFLEFVIDQLRPGVEWDYATTAEEGLALIHQRTQLKGGQPYDLVIADIFLDGEMTGLDSWLECANRFPNMPFVVTSSLSLDRYLGILRDLSSCPTFLQKPLTVGRCKTILEEYL